MIWGSQRRPLDCWGARLCWPRRTAKSVWNRTAPRFGARDACRIGQGGLWQRRSRA